MEKPRYRGVMGERVAGAADEPPPPREPWPIAGPPKTRWDLIALFVIATIAALIALASFAGGPAARSEPAAAPTPAAPWGQTAQAAAPDPPQAQRAPAPSPSPAALGKGSRITLPPGTVALYAPGGNPYGDVGGAAATIRERYDVRWLRAEIAGHGDLWVGMGALAGHAVALEQIPCSYSCNPNPTAAPARPPVVQAAPVWAPAPPTAIPCAAVGLDDQILGQACGDAAARQATSAALLPTIAVGPTATPIDVAAFPTARP